MTVPHANFRVEEGYAASMKDEDVVTHFFCEKLKDRPAEYFRGCIDDTRCSTAAAAITQSLMSYPNAYLWCFYGQRASIGVMRAVVRGKLTPETQRAAIEAYATNRTAVVGGYVVNGQSVDAAVDKMFVGEFSRVALRERNSWARKYYEEIGPNMYLPVDKGMCRTKFRDNDGIFSVGSWPDRNTFTPSTAARLRVTPAQANLHLTQLVVLNKLCRHACVEDVLPKYIEGEPLAEAAKRVYGVAQMGMSMYLPMADENTSNMTDIPFLKGFHTTGNLELCKTATGAFADVFGKLYVDATIAVLTGSKKVRVDDRVGECGPAKLEGSMLRKRLLEFSRAYYMGVPARLLYANYVGLLVGILCGPECADRLKKICKWCDSEEPLEWAQCATV
jgi:hypothetical protein